MNRVKAAELREPDCFEIGLDELNVVHVEKLPREQSPLQIRGAAFNSEHEFDTRMLRQSDRVTAFKRAKFQNPPGFRKRAPKQTEAVIVDGIERAA